MIITHSLDYDQEFRFSFDYFHNMRSILLFILIVLFVASCQPAVQEVQEVSYEPFANEGRPARASLVCKFIGEDENGIPSSEVYIEYKGDLRKVADCQNCNSITSEEYDNYAIPAGATDACGGWFAGAGDYFYIMQYHDRIELFAGWQDEGQITGGDNFFHWEHKSTIKIKSNYGL